MTLTVVDLGCADPEGSGWSLHHLANTYKPDRIYGFDPASTLNKSIDEIDGCPVVLRQAAASTYDGEARYSSQGSASRLLESGDQVVDCFAFSPWLSDLKGEIVVKMDIEGSEYPVLEQMLEDGTDRMLRELVIEWHDGPRDLESRLGCPVTEWGM